MLSHLEQNGYAMAPSFLTKEEVASLRTETDILSQRGAHKTNHRNIFDASPVLKDFAASPRVMNVAKSILGSSAKPIRGIVFDKTPDTNWSVPWHQDLNIAVATRLAVPGFGPWTIKEGVAHVVPPREVLESMITFRVHLDDCDADNGPLRVLPGTHRVGIIESSKYKEHITDASAVTCVANAGDLLLMRPLLLHTSATACHPRRRRVLHIEYAACDLPGGLAWKLEARPSSPAGMS